MRDSWCLPSPSAQLGTQQKWFLYSCPKESRNSTHLPQGGLKLSQSPSGRWPASRLSLSGCQHELALCFQEEFEIRSSSALPPPTPSAMPVPEKQDPLSHRQPWDTGEQHGLLHACLQDYSSLNSRGTVILRWRVHGLHLPPSALSTQLAPAASQF